ncbi:beta-1,6-N-acetylglucosaminyltransferase [Enterococcus viikkiensis]|uniref:beta-1,6-N-acetylglucosaminyltransferase n=1 Tax=Enterococcus viikkiensis TaxID=930854 RepID=UPI001477251B|nr:beta-1,6-N-acetylglucosaminyltransferase [Enterococcus viikkiensis]
MSKHAFLIIAHHKPKLLTNLIKQIDHEDNDIYIHIDKKSDLRETQFKTIPNKSKIYFTQRTSVNWGGFSQVNCELVLLAMAVNSNKNYAYYHLLSGVDMILKNQEDFHSFFELHNGKEFVQFQKEHISEIKLDRVKYFYPFQEMVGDKRTFKQTVYGAVNGILLRFQKLLKTSRIRQSNITFQMGSNWFSITNNFAKYVVEQIPNIRKQFKYTLCCDELFLQTLIVNSSFIDSLYYKNFDDSSIGNQRFIIWQNSRPIILTTANKKAILASDLLFARKFDDDLKDNLINTIMNQTEGV